MTMNSSPEHGKTPDVQSRGSFVPLLLLAIGFLGLTVIQTTQLLNDRRALDEVASQQATSLAAAHKIRVATDSLVSKMQVLADKGNPNAKLVVAELKQRGITINPNAVTPSPP